MTKTDIAVQITDLKKTYYNANGKAAKEALKGVSLDIPRGSFFGLLGPNGAGKSTMINIMAGLTVKTSGEVKICGYNIETEVRAAKCSIGVVPQELVIDTFFTVREALEFHAGYYGVPKEKRRTQEIIDALGLSEQADIHSRRLSGGMKRRLLVAKALVHNPEVLVLDEPTAGVDVELRQQLWRYVRGLNQNGTTVLLTTHYLEEAQELCDTIAIINHGKLVARDSKSNLMATLDQKKITIKPTSKLSILPEKLRSEGAILLENGELVFEYSPSRTTTGHILELVRSENIEITDISLSQADLEDVFRYYTNISHN